MTKNDLKKAWVDEIPDHWKMVRASLAVTPVERPPLAEDEVVTCFRDGEVTLRSNRRTDGFTVSFQEIGYQHIEVGDLVIHSMDGGWGAIGVSDSDGKASPVVHAYRSEENDVKFIAYVLRAMAYSGYLIAQTKGIRERSTQFDRKSFSNLYLPLPNLETQRSIADYLDKEISEMDALIEEFERLVEELQSRKQSLVINTFFDTEFSNPVYIDLSTSKYPTIPLKHASPYRIGWTPASSNASFYGEGHKWAKISDLGKKYISETETQITELAVSERGAPTPAKPGDLLFSFKLSVGTVSLVQEEMFTNEAIATFSPTPKVDMNFAYYAYPVYLQVNANTNIYGAPLLNSQIFSRARVPNLPIEEQREIADELDHEFERMDVLIEESTRLIENLRARKTVLITEVVTGRKEV